MTRFAAACVQLNAGTEIEPNLQAAGTLIRQARDAGATLIATPENTGFIAHGREAVLQRALPEAEHPGLPFFAGLARETGATLLIGSLSIGLPGGKAANRSYLFAPSGEILARYDKIHMFDVRLEGGENYRESSTFRPGESSVIAETPWGLLGMTVCYDLRFPYLYRALAHAGAVMLSIPSSFTVPTGRAHWHVLMRSRAIETGCFVFAPAQVGTHKGSNRKTYGHSVVVAPWGEVLADAGGEKAGFVVAEIDLAKVAEARKMVPSLQHDRTYAAPVLHKTAMPKAAE